MIKRIFGDRILIKPDRAEEKTESGIFLVQSSRVKKPEGIIVKTGTGRMLPDGSTAPVLFEPGMHVVYEAFSGQTVIMGDEEYILVPSAAVTMEID